jgi:hypothetical protein
MRNRSWVIALILASTNAVAVDRTIEPGLYEVVTKSNMGGTQTARRCLTATDIDKGFQTDLPKECKSTRAVVAGGKLEFATTCPDMSMTTTGTYTANSYAIDGKITMKGDDDPMTIESHITGKKVSDTCKGS